MSKKNFVCNIEYTNKFINITRIANTNSFRVFCISKYTITCRWTSSICTTTYTIQGIILTFITFI